MKDLLRLEELGMLLIALFALQYVPDQPWWLYALLFFSPDLSMLAYLAGPRYGAYLYNLAHHKLFALALLAAGWLLLNPSLQLLGLLFFAHSCFDRLLGYGLKHTSSFQDTHLGKIGRAQTSDKAFLK